MSFNSVLGPKCVSNIIGIAGRGPLIRVGSKRMCLRIDNGNKFLAVLMVLTLRRQGTFVLDRMPFLPLSVTLFGPVRGP